MLIRAAAIRGIRRNSVIGIQQTRREITRRQDTKYAVGSAQPVSMEETAERGRNVQNDTIFFISVVQILNSKHVPPKWFIFRKSICLHISQCFMCYADSASLRAIQGSVILRQFPRIIVICRRVEFFAMSGHSIFQILSRCEEINPPQNNDPRRIPTSIFFQADLTQNIPIYIFFVYAEEVLEKAKAQCKWSLSMKIR